MMLCVKKKSRRAKTIGKQKSLWSRVMRNQFHFQESRFWKISPTKNDDDTLFNIYENQIDQGRFRHNSHFCHFAVKKSTIIISRDRITVFNVEVIDIVH